MQCGDSNGLIFERAGILIVQRTNPIRRKIDKGMAEWTHGKVTFLTILKKE